tara:strand:+ start:247 stop:474 length:228 start_codon:yes stop_codon:yes gene_type:complete
MAKQTQRDKVKAALENAGYHEAASNSRKYIKMVHPRDPNGVLAYWLGKSGGVRKGRTIGDSFSVTDQMKAYIGTV